MRKCLVLICFFCAVTPFAAAKLFSKPTDYAVGSFPNALSIADFNHDGKADIAVADATDNTITVLLGNGDGTFQPGVAYPAGQGTSLGSVAAADFNEDGNLDLVATVSATGGLGGSFAILTGRGDGTFNAAVFTPSTISPLVVAVGDLNKDGHKDLFLGGNGDSAVALGNGDGTFQAPEHLNLTTSGTDTCGVAIADFNNDGIPDLIGTDGIGGTVVILLGNGDGTFQPPRSFPVLDCPVWLVTGDFNRDGNIDVMAVDYGSNAISVLLGNGDGTLQTAQTYFAGYYELGGAVADLNGDGKLDLIVSCVPSLSSNFSAVAVLAGKGDGTFSPALFYRSGVDEWAVAAANLNADHKPDVAITSPYTKSVNVLLNTLVH